MRVLLIILLLPIISKSQNIVITKDGSAPVVYNIDGYSKDSIYKRAIAWVDSYYRVPSEVLTVNEPDRIRVNAFMKNAYYVKQLGQKLYYDLYYFLEVDFKDEKIRVTFTPDRIMADGRPALFTVRTFFKDDGTVKNAYKDAVPSLSESANALVRSLTGFITAKKSDW